MNPETFILTFQSGKTVTLTVNYDGEKPRFVGGISGPLTKKERAQYEQWRTEVASQVLGNLTARQPENVAIGVLEKLLHDNGIK